MLSLRTKNMQFSDQTLRYVANFHVEQRGILLFTFGVFYVCVKQQASLTIKMHAVAKLIFPPQNATELKMLIYDFQFLWQHAHIRTCIVCAEI